MFAEKISLDVLLRRTEQMVYPTRFPSALHAAVTPLRAVWWTLAVLWPSLALWLILRRLSGALVHPPSGVTLLAVAIATVAVSGLLRVGIRRRDGVRLERLTPWLRAVWPSVTGFGLLAAITFATSSVVASMVAWGLWILCETGWWLLVLKSRRSGPHERAPPRPDPPDPGANRRSSPLAVALPDGSAVFGDAGPPEELLLQLLRVRNAEGDYLTGRLRVAFAAGEQQQVAHVLFQPPFESVPAVEVAELDGPGAVAAVSQVERFGMRLEVKRAGPAETAVGVLLELQVAAPAE